MNLTQPQVEVWFQNRRIRSQLRKEQQQKLSANQTSSTSPHQINQTPVKEPLPILQKPTEQFSNENLDDDFSIGKGIN